MRHFLVAEAVRCNTRRPGKLSERLRDFPFAFVEIEFVYLIHTHTRFAIEFGTENNLFSNADRSRKSSKDALKRWIPSGFRVDSELSLERQSSSKGITRESLESLAKEKKENHLNHLNHFERSEVPRS